MFIQGFLSPSCRSMTHVFYQHPHELNPILMFCPQMGKQGLGWAHRMTSSRSHSSKQQSASSRPRQYPATLVSEARLASADWIKTDPGLNVKLLSNRSCHPLLLDEDASWHRHFKRQPVSFLKTKHTLPIRSGNRAPKCLPK